MILALLNSSAALQLVLPFLLLPLHYPLCVSTPRLSIAFHGPCLRAIQHSLFPLQFRLIKLMSIAKTKLISFVFNFCNFTMAFAHKS
jgi:hypothetical protein